MRQSVDQCESLEQLGSDMASSGVGTACSIADDIIISGTESVERSAAYSLAFEDRINGASASSQAVVSVNVGSVSERISLFTVYEIWKEQ